MRKHFIVLTATLAYVMSCKSIGFAQEKTQTSIKAAANTIIVDLDQPAKFVYTLKTLSRCRIGIRPGEFGMKLVDTNNIGPGSVAVDFQGNLYVDDAVNHRIQRFDENGHFKSIEFVYPSDFQVLQMFVDKTGRLYLHDYSKHTWQILHGKVEKTYTDGKDGSLRFMPNGDVMAWDWKSNTYYSLDGKLLFSGTSSDGKERFAWTNDREVVMSSKDPKEKAVIILTKTLLQRFEILIKSKDDFVMTFKNSSQTELVYLLHFQDRDMVFQIRVTAGIDTKSIRLRDDARRLNSAVVSNGIIYGINAGENGDIGSRRYFCEIVKGEPSAK